MEQPQLMKPGKRDGQTEVLPDDLDKGILYLIEQGDNRFDVYRYKGIFLENVRRDDTSDPPVIESRFRIEESPQELVELLGEQPIGAEKGFSNYQTRYYLAKAQNIIDKKVFAKMISAQKFDPTEEDLQNPKNDVGNDLANYFYGPEPKRAKKGGTKRKTKRTKRAKKGTKTKTKRTKRAKKGGTKTKRTT
jgi:hypothetical protein